MLSMEKIGKSFSGVRVLDNVPFDLKPGEVHVLAGENGAGKTTLMRILAGVYSDYEGKIWINGKNVRFKSPLEAASYGVSFIHQEMSLINSMTVADNIFLGREKSWAGIWMNYHSQQKKAGALLEQFNIDVNFSKPVEDCPLSVRQMIEIAKALVYEARIIIMDEPTSSLTDIEVQRLFEIIMDLKNKGCGIIYISHRLDEIYQIAERISVLRDGKHIGTSAPEDLPPGELIRWMVGREISQQFPERLSRPGKELLKVRGFYLPDPTGSKRWAVEDVSLTLSRGEILGIAGLQGSGKSELLHGLFGSYGKITKGKVFLDGQPYTIRSPIRSIERGLALLTNDRKGTGLIPAMSITRNISLASLKDFSQGGWMLAHKEEEAAAEQVKSFDIKSRSLHQEVNTLSGGNQQKVVLAKWIGTQPKVLLLDEPTLGVDVGAKYDIYNLMNQWTAQGIAIILITSELPELLAMSDRIIVMHRGRITAEFSRKQANQEKIIKAAMGKRVTI
jgi:ribose transport system ATP-binding protein